MEGRGWAGFCGHNVGGIFFVFNGIIYDKVLLTRIAMESLKDMSVENQFLVDVAIFFYFGGALEVTNPFQLHSQLNSAHTPGHEKQRRRG